MWFFVWWLHDQLQAFGLFVFLCWSWKAAPPVSTFSFRSLLMLVHETLVTSEVHLSDLDSINACWLPQNSRRHLQQPPLYVISVFFPLLFHEHERKRSLFTWHSRELRMKNIKCTPVLIAYDYTSPYILCIQHVFYEGDQLNSDRV